MACGYQFVQSAGYHGGRITMKDDFTRDIASELIKRINDYKPSVSARQVGHVISVADGVARVSGLPQVASMERVEFTGGIAGLAINLEEDVVGVIILGDYLQIHEGDEVRATGQLLSMPVGDGLSRSGCQSARRAG